MKEAPTPNEFKEKMKELSDGIKIGMDLEEPHKDMDEYLCQTLEALGYSEGIKLFRTTPKWYS